VKTSQRAQKTRPAEHTFVQQYHIWNYNKYIPHYRISLGQPATTILLLVVFLALIPGTRAAARTPLGLPQNCQESSSPTIPQQRNQPYRIAREKENPTKTQRASSEINVQELEKARKSNKTRKRKQPKAPEPASVPHPSKRTKKKKMRKKRTHTIEMKRELRILTQNIRGGIEKKIELIREHIEKKDIDIMIITETNALIDLIQTREKIRERIPSCRIFANGYTRKQIEDRYETKEIERIRKLQVTEDKQKQELLNINRKNAQAHGGIWVLVHERLARYLQGEPIIGEDRRSILLTLKFPNEKINVLGVYGPPEEGKEREACFEKWHQTLQNNPETPFIIMGDFNTYTNPERDTWSIRREKTPAKGHAMHSLLIDENNLSDAYLLKHAKEATTRTGHTFIATRDHEDVYSARIDIALVANQLQGKIIDCKPIGAQ
jgi:hypothetical protein